MKQTLEERVANAANAAAHEQPRARSKAQQPSTPGASSSEVELPLPSSNPGFNTSN